MNIAVGIPKALLYYKYAPLWETFFKELGAEVKVSPFSNKRILKKGLLLAESEICLPVKAFFGHVVELSHEVDFLFIPRLVGVEKKAYTCPKFLGLPDMVKACDYKVPKVLSPIVDLQQGRLDYYKNIIKVGQIFTNKIDKIFWSYRKALAQQKKEKIAFHQGDIPYLVNSKTEQQSFKKSDQPIRIAIVGHPYNIYDPYTSLNLIDRLKKLGVEIITPEMLQHRAINKEANRLPKKLFWTYEKEIVGAALYFLHKRNVDGVIYVLSFACGPDSLIELLLQNKYKNENKIPLMSLVIDEHASETGMMTRLEAFVDMIKYSRNQRKKVVV